MIRRIVLLLTALLLYETNFAQIRVISGIIKDSATHDPLPNVSIREKDGSKGTLSDEEGKFRIAVDSGTDQLIFSATGYHPYYLSLSDSSAQEYEIVLSKSFTTLAQVVIKSRKKEKYRNKGNPAVELIRKVIANKSENGPKASDYLSYKQYEKARILLDKPPRGISHNFLTKKFSFVFDNVDSTMYPPKKLFPVYQEEVVSQNYFRKDPEKKKKRVLARKATDLGEYVDMKAVSEILGRLYEEVNIYDNTVNAFTMQFMSPIADLSPTFYMYFIQDTVEAEGIKLVKLYFRPRNPEDLLFSGTMWISLDGRYAVKKIELEVSKHINLNYIRNFRLKQDFEKGGDGHYHLSRSTMTAFFSPFPRTPAIYGERSIGIQDLNDSVINDLALTGRQVDTAWRADQQPDSFWVAGRPAPLNDFETKTYSNADSLVRMPAYNRLLDLITLFTVGYKSAGKIEIGKIGNFYSFNHVEGQRVQFGMRSKPSLSTRYFADGYAAYGFGDKKWKYYLCGTYSINNRSIYSFPFHYIQVSYMNDTRALGEEDIFSSGNSFLSSFNRGLKYGWLYNQTFRLSYVHELQNHLSYTLGFKHWVQQPAGSLAYIYKTDPGFSDTARQITTSEISASIRWAPHEQFYQGKVMRRDIINKYPIFSLQYAKGIAGLAGGGYNYDAFRLTIFKRMYTAPLGFSDIAFHTGYLIGNLPYPLLFIHTGSQNFFYSMNSYNLMNSGEFLGDHYAGVNIDHYFNGFFLNKIPLIKKLRLREVVECKLLFSGLRYENNPAVNPAQMQFPTLNGVTSSFAMGSQPYFEAGIGIYNIFSFMRIDLIKRFTYLHNPDISTLGLRFSSNLNF